MFGESMSGYSKALVFGTGGGNDIVSAVLAAMYLQRSGIETDVGGVLSPAAVHSFGGCLEEAVNRIGGCGARREIPAKAPVEIKFLDGFLPGFVEEEGAYVPGFYDFSIRFGTQKLVEGVNRLVEENGYDVVIGVDVGGDVLGRGREDPTILSPAMDFASLYLLGRLNVDSYLVEFGLGTDGELRPEGMSAILEELREKRLMLHEGSISAGDGELKKFRGIYEKVRKIREGNTARMTLQTLDTKTPGQDIISRYRFKSQIGKKVWETPYMITLPHGYFGKSYVIDAKGLAGQRKDTAFPFENPLEQYVKLKMVDSWKTELDLLYLWSGEGWKTFHGFGECMMLLAPSTAAPAWQRAEMLREGVSHLMHGNTDLALVLKQEMEYVPGVVCDISAGCYSILFANCEHGEAAYDTAQKIRGWQLDVC